MPVQRKHPERVLQENNKLSLREHEILIHLSCGNCNKAIADSLGVTINTVEKHLTSIYKKLNVKSRMEAVLWWVENGRVFRN